MLDRELLDLIELCYACIAETDGWQKFLVACHAAFAATASSVGTFRLSPPSIDWLVAGGLTPEDAAELPRRGVEDPRSALFSSLRRGEAYSFDDSHDITTFKASDYWREYQSRLGMLWAAIARLDDGRDLEGLLALHRPEEAPCFDAKETYQVGVLARHVGRARRLQLDLEAARAHASLSQNLLDRLPIALLFLQGSGRVAEANRSARELADANDGLTLRVGQIVCADSTNQKKLDAMVQAAARGLLDGVGGVLSVPRPSGKPDYVVSIARCVSELSSALGAAAAVVMTIADPTRKVGVEAATLRRLWDLTAAEAQLALALADGLTLEEVAERSGITMNTARAHLKRALTKSGTHRQSELVRLILTGPGSVL